MRRGGGKAKGSAFEREVWLPIGGFSGYWVSDFGRIKVEGFYQDGRSKTARVLPSNSYNVGLRKDGKTHWFKRSALVLLAFVGPPPAGKTLARHLDDDRSHNTLTNLAWGSYQDNYNDAVRNGRHGPGSKGALLRGDSLRGIPRPQYVKDRIRQTKRGLQ